MKAFVRDMPADTVATSYVELTVAIVTLESRVLRLEALLGEQHETTKTLTATLVQLTETLALLSGRR